MVSTRIDQFTLKLFLELDLITMTNDIYDECRLSFLRNKMNRGGRDMNKGARYERLTEGGGFILNRAKRTLKAFWFRTPLLCIMFNDLYSQTHRTIIIR